MIPIVRPWKGGRYGKLYHGLIISRYPQLVGRDWIRCISAEDRKVLADIGRSNTPNNFHHLGGKARAKKATRDAAGRFVFSTKEASDEQSARS